MVSAASKKCSCPSMLRSTLVFSHSGPGCKTNTQHAEYFWHLWKNACSVQCKQATYVSALVYHDFNMKIYLINIIRS